MRWLAGLLLLAQAVLGQGGAGGPVACLEVLKGLEVQAFYREGPDLLVLLGRERPLLVLALEGGRLWPHPRPPRGRPLPKRPFPFLRELTLAPWVLEVGGSTAASSSTAGGWWGSSAWTRTSAPCPSFRPGRVGGEALWGPRRGRGA